jgi:hypothetical protein
MALLQVIRREKLQALSTPAVLFLVIAMGLFVAAVLVGTGVVFLQAGYPWLYLLVCPYLADGLGRSWIENARYCRPQWFKPKGQW